MTGWLVASCRGGDIIGYWNQWQVFRHDDYQNALWRGLTRQMTKFSWAFWQDLIRISVALSIEIKQCMHVTVPPAYCFEYWLVKYHLFVIRRGLFVIQQGQPRRPSTRPPPWYVNLKHICQTALGIHVADRRTSSDSNMRQLSSGVNESISIWS